VTAEAQALAVVVTRAESLDGPLSTELRSLGLNVLLWPAVRTAPAAGNSLERALAHIQDFDWIVFASRQAVTAVIRWLPRLPQGVRVAAIGRATAQVLQRRGFAVDLMPNEANAAALVDAFAAVGCAGAKILYPASSRALPTITQGLTQLGAEVRQVEAYRTEAAVLDADDCRAWIDREVIGAVTFASPSAVIELERALGLPHFTRLLAQAAVVAIGPTTARALAERGRTAVLAESATLSGLANTTLRLLQTRP
jgi:uroporphyrinogen-III synthase